MTIATETVSPYGEVSRMALVMFRTATVNDEVLFEGRYDDTDVVYRSLTLTREHHDALGAPERITVTVEPGDRLHVHSPFTCPTHAKGCGCPDDGMVCNPYHEPGSCPDNLTVLEGACPLDSETAPAP